MRRLFLSINEQSTDLSKNRTSTRIHGASQTAVRLSRPLRAWPVKRGIKTMLETAAEKGKEGSD
jgi:hypothetical protein